MQKIETDNLLFEVGWKQKALYGRMFDGGKSEKAKDIIYCNMQQKKGGEKERDVPPEPSTDPGGFLKIVIKKY